MKFKITFQLLNPGQLLPLSYQYELSSWIYKLINSGNPDFATFLHDKGYVSLQKNFKFFCFSQLFFPKNGFKIQADRMQVLANEISLELSFLVDEAAQYLIIGIFENQKLALGDRISQVDLFVKSIELLPLELPTAPALAFRCHSPMVVSAPVNAASGKLQHKYLSPLDEEFETYFEQNLVQKYIAAVQHNLLDVNANIAKSELKFKLLSDSKNVRSKLVTIKAHTPAETKIKGFIFDFELTAPPELQKLAYLVGLGTENAMGFGSLKLLK